jgi:hypothetical protein
MRADQVDASRVHFDLLTSEIELAMTFVQIAVPEPSWQDEFSYPLAAALRLRTPYHSSPSYYTKLPHSPALQD